MSTTDHSELSGIGAARTAASEAAPTGASQEPRKKQRRGFAAMDPSKQREIASKGGRASHEKGTGHEWTAQSAAAAGRKGGLSSHGGKGGSSEG